MSGFMPSSAASASSLVVGGVLATCSSSTRIGPVAVSRILSATDGMLCASGADLNVLWPLRKSLYATGAGAERRERRGRRRDAGRAQAESSRRDRSVSAELRRALRRYLNDDDSEQADDDEESP